MEDVIFYVDANTGGMSCCKSEQLACVGTSCVTIVTVCLTILQANVSFVPIAPAGVFEYGPITG